MFDLSKVTTWYMFGILLVALLFFVICAIAYLEEVENE